MKKIKNICLLILTTIMFGSFFFVGVNFVKASAAIQLENKVLSTNFYMVNGAEIRYGTSETEMGLRFTMLIDNKDYQEIKNDVSFGMFLLPKDYVEIHPLETDLSFYYWENSNGDYVDKNNKILSDVSGKAYVVNFQNVSLSLSNKFVLNDMVSFSGALINIKDGSDWENFNIDRDFVGVGYIQYINSNGDIDYKFVNKIYSENKQEAIITDYSYVKNSRSMGYISQRAIEDAHLQITALKEQYENALGGEKELLEAEINDLADRINTLNKGYLGKINGFYQKVLANGDIHEEYTYSTRELIDDKGNGLGVYQKYPTLDIEYNIEYYFEDDNGDFVLDVSKTKVLSSKAGDVVSITPEYFEGYTFDDNNANNILSSKLYVNKTVLKMYYKQIKHTVLFRDYDNTVFATKKVAQGEKVENILEKPSKPNFYFLYWERDGEKFDFDTIINEDIELTPKMLENIYVEHTSTLYYWHTQEDRFGSMSFGEQFYGKKTLAKGTVENNLGNCVFNANWEFNLSENEINNLISNGFTKLSFNIYLDASFSPIEIQVINSSNIFEISANKWEEVTINLEDLLAFDGSLIKISNYTNNGTTFSIAIADAFVMQNSSSKSVNLLNSSNLYEYCANGPDNGYGIRTDNVIVDDVLAKTVYTKSTRNTEYGTTFLSANWRYDLNSSEINNLLANGKEYVAITVYFGVELNKSGITHDFIDVATLDDSNNSQPYSTNTWHTFYFSLTSFSNILDEGFTFRLWPKVNGSGDYNGTYYIALKDISFVEERPFEILSSSTLYEYCANGPDNGYAELYKDIIVDGKNADISFVKSTRNTEYGPTILTANIQYSCSEDYIQKLIDDGYSYISMQVYFGASLNNPLISLNEIDVATLNDDNSRTTTLLNKWIPFNFSLLDFKNIISEGYTFRLWPQLKGNGDYNGTYSISISNICFEKSYDINAKIELTDDSRVFESCSNPGAPNQGNWSKVTDVTIDGKECLYNFYNETKSMSWGNTTMSVYPSFNMLPDQLLMAKSYGFKFLNFNAYFGISKTVANISNIDVSYLNNKDAIYNLPVNTWIKFSFSIDDIILIVKNNGYIFELNPVANGDESTCGLYSIAFADLTLSKTKIIDSSLMFNDSTCYEYCANGPDNGFADREINRKIAGINSAIFFEKDTINTEYGTTYFTVNSKFNISSSDVISLINDGYDYVALDIYIGVYGTILPVSEIQISAFGNDLCLINCKTNCWQKLYLSINDFKDFIENENYFLRMWLPIRGDGKYNGRYSLGFNNVSFAKDISVSFIGGQIPNQKIISGESIDLSKIVLENYSISHFMLNNQYFDKYTAIYDDVELELVLDKNNVKLNQNKSEVYYQDTIKHVAENIYEIEFDGKEILLYSYMEDCEDAIINYNLDFDFDDNTINTWIDSGYTHIEALVYTEGINSFTTYGFKNTITSVENNNWNKVFISLSTLLEKRNTTPMFITSCVSGDVTFMLSSISLCVTPNEFLDDYIVDDNKATNYKIIIPDGTFNDEISFAADELVDLLYQSLGVKLQVVTTIDNDNSRYISLGNTQLFNETNYTIDVNEVGNQGYYIKTDSLGNIFIYSSTALGVLNGVYGYLENEFAYDYFYTDIYTINSFESVVKADLEYVVKPDIEYRVVGDGWNYSATSNDSKYRLKMINYEDLFIYSPGEGGCWHNAFGYLEPANDYSAHPKWFNVVNGETKQICYTAHGSTTEYNKMVEHVVIDMLGRLQAEPNKNIIAFNNMDNDNHCSCSSCSSIIYRYGARSATIIRFLNDVAIKIESELIKINDHRANNFEIEFMAYWGCESAPVVTTYDTNGNPSFSYDSSVKLNKHLVPMYASVANWFYTESIYSQKNAGDREALLEWAELSSNGILLWGYDAHFTNYGYMFPFVSYDVYSDLYKYAKEVGVRWIMMEGQKLNEGGAPGFSALKGYLQSKLGYDVDQDVDLLIDKYFDAMYGSQSNEMKHVFNDIISFVKDNEKLCGHNIDFNANYFDASNWDYSKVLSWYNIMKECEQNLILENEYVLARNIRMEIMFPMFTLIKTFGETKYQDDFNELLDEFNIVAYSQIEYVN